MLLYHMAACNITQCAQQGPCYYIYGCCTPEKFAAAKSSQDAQPDNTYLGDRLEQNFFNIA